VIGKESASVTRRQVEEFIEKARADAQAGRLNLTKGCKLVLGFHDAANQDLQRLAEEDGKDLAMKRVRLSLHLTPFLGETPLLKITSFDIERYK
jgi:hypothetical protein